MWVTVVALQILLNDTYKLNHCKEMGAEPRRRFLTQPAEKLKAVFVTSPFNGDITHCLGYNDDNRALLGLLIEAFS